MQSEEEEVRDNEVRTQREKMNQHIQIIDETKQDVPVKITLFERKPKGDNSHDEALLDAKSSTKDFVHQNKRNHAKTGICGSEGHESRQSIGETRIDLLSVVRTE